MPAQDEQFPRRVRGRAVTSFSSVSRGGRQTSSRTHQRPNADTSRPRPQRFSIRRPSRDDLADAVSAIAVPLLGIVARSRSSAGPRSVMPVGFATRSGYVSASLVQELVAAMTRVTVITMAAAPVFANERARAHVHGRYPVRVMGSASDPGIEGTATGLGRFHCGALT